MDYADVFKAVGEPSRFGALRVLILAREELRACDIIETLKVPQYAISKCMGALVAAGLITERREGRKMLYALIDPHFNAAIFEAIKHVPQGGDLASDTLRLRKRLAAETSTLACKTT
jgi:DNA-binding transcriptional ArsR family regulator